MRAHRGGLDLLNALKEEGFELPPLCGDIILEMPVDGVVRLHYSEMLSGERLAQFSRALVKLGDKWKESEK